MSLDPSLLTQSNVSDQELAEFIYKVRSRMAVLEGKTAKTDNKEEAETDRLATLGGLINQALGRMNNKVIEYLDEKNKNVQPFAVEKNALNYLMDTLPIMSGMRKNMDKLSPEDKKTYASVLDNYKKIAALYPHHNVMEYFSKSQQREHSHTRLGHGRPSRGGR
jgi:hypothetical protein